jgi:hypothetical protein
MWTPFMVARTFKWGVDAAKVVNLLVADGRPMARTPSGVERPEFIDADFPKDTALGGRSYGMDRLFSGLVAMCSELDTALDNGILNDSIAHARERIKGGFKFALRSQDDAPYHNQVVATELIKFFLKEGSTDVAVPDELRASLIETIRNDFDQDPERRKNHTFMTYPDLKDASSKQGDWKTMPNTASPARPELSIMEGQFSSREDDSADAAAAGAPGAAAAGSKKKAAVWKKAQQTAHCNSIGYKFQHPISVAESEAFFKSQGYVVENNKPLVTIIGLDRETRKIVERPLTHVGMRHLDRDIIFRVRIAPKIQKGERGLSVKWVTKHIQVIGFYASVTGQAPLYRVRGELPTRNLAIEGGDFFAETARRFEQQQQLAIGGGGAGRLAIEDGSGKRRASELDAGQQLAADSAKRARSSAVPPAAGVVTEGDEEDDSLIPDEPEY